MPSFKEQMDLDRRNLLIGIAVGYGAWQVSVLLDRIPSGWIWLHTAFIVTGLLGWLFFTFQLVRMGRMVRQMRDHPDQAKDLDDEYVQQKRSQAFRFAFWMVLGCQVVILLINFFIPLDAALTAQVTLLTAVLSAIGAFLYLDRETVHA